MLYYWGVEAVENGKDKSYGQLLICSMNRAEAFHSYQYTADMQKAQLLYCLVSCSYEKVKQLSHSYIDTRYGMLDALRPDQ